jgi:hypothetical protein
MPPTDPTEFDFLIPEWLQGTPLGIVWRTAYILTGEGGAAIEAVRADEGYDLIFAGNKREDGSVRYTEGEYLATIESYEDSISAIGLNSQLPQFQDMFVKLIEGNVSGPEFWQDRVKVVFDRVMQNTDAVREEYAKLMGIGITDEEILASILDPEGLGVAILDQTISISELRGEYTDRWKDIDGLEADYFIELDKYGIDQDMARNLFANADTMVPAIQVLANRHADPDDTFDLQEFTNAAIYADPFQASRMRRLMAQERSSFASSSSQIDVVRSRLTGAVGLEER